MPDTAPLPVENTPTEKVAAALVTAAETVADAKVEAAKVLADAKVQADGILKAKGGPRTTTDRIAGLEDIVGDLKTSVAVMNAQVEAHEKNDETRHVATMDAIKTGNKISLYMGLALMALLGLAFVAVVTLAGKSLGFSANSGGVNVGGGPQAKPETVEVPAASSSMLPLP